MKKWYSVIVALVLALMLAGSPVYADPVVKDGAGTYQHTVTGKTKYFTSHPVEPSQWVLVNEDPEPYEDGAHATVTGDYDVEAWNLDESYSRSLWGWGNDEAYAFGNVMIGGELYTFADGEPGVDCVWVHDIRYPDWMFWKGHFERVEVPAEAYEQGFIMAVSKAKAWSWAKDYGFTSKAGAGAKFDEGFVIIEGSAFGDGGEKEYLASKIKFGGLLGQWNIAKEVDYPAGGIVASNNSSLSFEAYMPLNQVEHKDGAILIDGTSYTPEAITKGKSEVTIDPFGSVRSISGYTENMAKLSFSPCYTPEVLTSELAGSGVVSGLISNGPSYGAGTATFNYTGSSYGAGSAQLDAVVKTTQNYTSVVVNGSSHAVAE